jgi:hypothetical protein
LYSESSDVGGIATKKRRIVITPGDYQNSPDRGAQVLLRFGMISIETPDSTQDGLMENMSRIDSDQQTSADKELLMALGSSFAALRWTNRISAEKLSLISGISLQTITDFETGELDIDVLTLLTLTESMKVSCSELFAFVEGPKSTKAFSS